MARRGPDLDGAKPVSAHFDLQARGEVTHFGSHRVDRLVGGAVCARFDTARGKVWGN